MSEYILGKMLASSGPLFESMLNSFEKATGETSIDVQLLGDILERTSVHLQKLNLRPDDTTAEELVQALKNRFESDAQKIDHQVLGQNQDMEFFNSQVLRLLNQILDQSVYCLRERSSIKLLQDFPAERTMKKLKVKTSDEVISSFNVLEFMTVAWFLESPEWQAQVVRAISKMTSEDFELREIYFVSMNQKLAKLLTQKDGFVRNSLLGAILFRPFVSRPNHGIITALLSGLKVAKKLVDEANQLQFLVLSANYEKYVIDWLLDYANPVWQLDAVVLPWRSIYRALSAGGALTMLLSQTCPSTQLTKVNVVNEMFNQFPVLAFWSETEFLAYRYQNQVVSLSLLDVAGDDYAKFAFGTHQFFEEALWDELLLRYFNKPNLAARLLLFLNEKILGRKTSVNN